MVSGARLELLDAFVLMFGVAGSFDYVSRRFANGNCAQDDSCVLAPDFRMNAQSDRLL